MQNWKRFLSAAMCAAMVISAAPSTVLMAEETDTVEADVTVLPSEDAADAESENASDADDQAEAESGDAADAGDQTEAESRGAADAGDQTEAESRGAGDQTDVVSGDAADADDLADAGSEATDDQADADSQTDADDQADTDDADDDADADTTVTRNEFKGYVLMNIPYADFYAAEGDDDVDAVSSATKAKPLTASLAGGSYHVNADGSDITGVTYAVKMDAETFAKVAAAYTEVKATDSISITATNRGTTTTTVYIGADALFGADSYSYYILAEEPASYKELTIAEDGSLSFGKLVGETTTIDGVEATITTETSYGDYQITVPTDVKDFSAVTVYGVALTTTDKAVYGLRHIENIWRGNNLAFSTGHTTEVHGCTLTYDNYVSLEGKKIQTITYYTSEGIYELTLDKALYAAPYYTGEVTAEFTSATELSVKGLPRNAKNVTVSVSYTTGEGRNAVTTTVLDSASLKVGKVTLEEAVEEGTEYTVTIRTDNYATMTTTASYTAPEEPEEPEVPETPVKPGFNFSFNIGKTFQTITFNFSNFFKTFKFSFRF